MSLLSSSAALREEVNGLTEAWLRAGEQWSDSQHVRMGELYIDPLNKTFAAADDALQVMSQVLAKAQRDCGWTS
jgi:hypothetical protein